jgi:hypothetical protein
MEGARDGDESDPELDDDLDEYAGGGGGGGSNGRGRGGGRGSQGGRRGGRGARPQTGGKSPKTVQNMGGTAAKATNARGAVLVLLTEMCTQGCHWIARLLSLKPAQYV